MKKFMCSLIVLGILLMPGLSLPHPGRTDAQGGHYNRTTGEYHFHGSKAASPSPQQAQPASSPQSQTPDLSETKTSPKQGGYHGNVSSKKFHSASCQYFNCSNCTAVFQTREAAIKAGYVPCKICNP
jgi:hypothetical protein